MSLPSDKVAGGKVLRDKRRRTSDPQPYRKPAKAPTMPTTRHSPARAAPSANCDVLRELALLRQSIESQFKDSGDKVDCLKEEVLTKLETNDQTVAELQLAVTEVTLGVDKNQRAIQVVRAEAERMEQELPKRVKAIVNEALARSSGPSGPLPGFPTGPRRPRPPARSLEEVEEGFIASETEASTSRSDSYWLARRSLRLWPVSREGLLKERTAEFLVNELLLEEQLVADLSFEVKRIGGKGREGRDSKIRDEVLVRFETTRERDEVRSHARNLERKGRGLRLEVPDHLWPSFRVLQDIAFELKQKNPSLRRNILFNDARLDLKLDISIKADEWRTIYPDGARESLKKIRPSSSGRLAVSSQELDELLAPAPGSPADADMDGEEY